jgi:hypothetical protein
MGAGRPREETDLGIGEVAGFEGGGGPGHTLERAGHGDPLAGGGVRHVARERQEAAGREDAVPYERLPPVGLGGEPQESGLEDVEGPAQLGQLLLDLVVGVVRDIGGDQAIDDGAERRSRSASRPKPEVKSLLDHIRHHIEHLFDNQGV